MSGATARVGPYQLEGQLGSGSMGAVFRGRHVELGVHHAVKLLRPELSRPGDQERFRREIELLARVSHPGLVRIHASDLDRGRLWYAMDLVEGEDLERKLTRGPLEPRLAARLVRDVARAVASMHAKGVIHRDLKPANVVVDAQGMPRLVDMGLARVVTDEARRLTLTGELVGTPYYMAPEQARGGQVGPHTDVWGLGMILYALLAGRPGVQGSATAEVLEEVRAGRVAPLEREAPQVPRGLVAVVRRALDPDPLRRYAGAQELAQALDTWLRSGAGDGRSRVPLTVGLAVLAVGGASLVAVAILVVRGKPRGPAAPPAAATAPSRALEEGQSRLSALSARLEAAGPIASEELEALAGVRVALAERRAALPADAATEQVAELVLLEGRLLIGEGEAVLRGGDLERARARLSELEALQEPRAARALRDLVRDGAAGLRGGLSVLAPGERDDTMALLGDLARLSDAAPGRVDLRAWRISLALRAGRAADAEAALEKAPDPARIPPDLRAETWIANGKLDRAEQLTPALSRPVLGKLLWQLTLRAIDGSSPTDALGVASEAMRTAPTDPLRADAVKAADGLVQRCRRWSSADAPEQLGAAVRAEIEASRLRGVLEPGWKLDDARVVEVCRSFVSAGPVLKGETANLLAGLLEVSHDLGELYRLHAVTAVEWLLPDPRRDQALMRRGIELFAGKDEETVGCLRQQLAMALDLRQDLTGLMEMAEKLPADASPQLRTTVLSRAANLLRFVGRLDEAATWLRRAQQLGTGAHELVLYEHALERALWERAHEEAHRQRALELAWTWLRGWTVEERSTWSHWLGPTCGWVCLQEESLGRQDRALEALELLLRGANDAPRWGAHRLILLARAEPLAEDALREGIPTLSASIEQVGDDLAAQAEAVAADSERNRRLRELAAGFHALVNLRYLEEALAVDDLPRLRDGLERLEQRLAALEDRLNAGR